MLMVFQPNSIDLMAFQPYLAFCNVGLNSICGNFMLMVFEPIWHDILHLWLIHCNMLMVFQPNSIDLMAFQPYLAFCNVGLNLICGNFMLMVFQPNGIRYLCNIEA